jgi:hypothetical protein
MDPTEDTGNEGSDDGEPPDAGKSSLRMIVPILPIIPFFVWAAVIKAFRTIFIGSYLRNRDMRPWWRSHASIYLMLPCALLEDR